MVLIGGNRPLGVLAVHDEAFLTFAPIGSVDFARDQRPVLRREVEHVTRLRQRWHAGASYEPDMGAVERMALVIMGRVLHGRDLEMHFDVDGRRCGPG